MAKENKKYSVSVTHKDGSSVEIKGEIEWNYLTSLEDKAFAKLSQKLEIAGFRKGNVPEEIARKNIPDELVLADMAELAISEIYPSIIKDHNLDVIGTPELSITKMARGNALGFTIRSAVLPEIKLPDYKTIAKSVPLTPPNDVTDENVEKVINDLRQIRAYGHVHGEGDSHSHTEELPEFNDEFVKSFGNFANTDEFKTKIRENLTQEAKQSAKDKRRISIMESIIAETKFDVPEILIKSESDKMFAQIESDVARSGVKIDEYLSHIKKTREEIAKEFRPEAEKRARLQLVLNAIARQDQISPTEEEVTAEAEKLMNIYPEADLARAKAYADMVITNNKVFTMLESQ